MASLTANGVGRNRLHRAHPKWKFREDDDALARMIKTPANYSNGGQDDELKLIAPRRAWSNRSSPSSPYDTCEHLLCDDLYKYFDG